MQPNGQTGRGSVMFFPVAFSCVTSVSMDAVGAASRRMANVPATCGAAIEVPLKTPKVSGPGGIEDVMVDPGANRRFVKIDGLPMFEKLETPSLFVEDATGTADEIHPGEAMASV